MRRIFGALIALGFASSSVLAQSNSGAAPQPSSPPQTSVLTSGLTYTTPTDAYGRAPLWLDVTLYGPGGPGSGGGTTPSNGTVSASDTTFGSVTAAHGAAASGLTGGAVGACTGADYADPVQAGGPGASGFTFAAGGFGGGVQPGFQGSGTPIAPPANSGYGGPGGSAQANASPGGGGGQGAVCHIRISNPAASYSVNVGPASVGGTTGTGGTAGQAGAAGRIIAVANFP